MKQAIPIKFFTCTWEKAEREARQRHGCDLWVLDWPAVDQDWVLGAPSYGNRVSELARSYYYQVVRKIDDAMRQAYSQCVESHYASPSSKGQGLRIAVSTRLGRGAAMRVGSPGSKGIAARLSVPFSANATSQPPTPCPMLPRELFSEPIDFDYTIHLSGGGNIRWELTQWKTEQAPYFALYDRTLWIAGVQGLEHETSGQVRLVFEQVVDLWVRFAQRPIPDSAADRIDPAQPLTYQLSESPGFFGIAAVVEVMHMESGQIASRNIIPMLKAGKMSDNLWPISWNKMSIDDDGVIRHGNVDFNFSILTPSHEWFEPKSYGTYHLRVILLAYGYQTGPRYCLASVSGVAGKLRMSMQPISLSYMPSLISYTPGLTKGVIPPLEVIFTRSPALRAGIEFDAVFDMKNLTTFRFVVKVGNTFDFAVGLVVQAASWQAWVHLEPGETKHLAGCVSISGMNYASTFTFEQLHPQLQSSVWQTGGGQYSIMFSLALTAPDHPETTPANMPALKATKNWTWNIASFDPQYGPMWGAIKKYAADGRYDYEGSMGGFDIYNDGVSFLNRSISKPSHQPLIDPSTYFVTGYQTYTAITIDGWWQRPWPKYSGWGPYGPPIRVNAEKLSWNGSENVWAPVEAVSITLTRAMLQQVAALLGITEYVVMDGDDLRWCVPNPPSSQNNSWSWYDVLWIDRFYKRDGTLIDDAAMRAAFQAVIDSNAASWPNYRNIVIHPDVRFGTFLGTGTHEVGDCLLGLNGDMVEVSSLAALSSVSTRFLYYIRPEFR
ncbi:hypothetical protein [Thiofaba sp. EF100]|uniref:hypothetical protein n=1 Tax=Thiofaba sp. EF100 TaxID=3121274 RepID=UPI0032213F7C